MSWVKILGIFSLICEPPSFPTLAALSQFLRNLLFCTFAILFRAKMWIKQWNMLCQIIRSLLSLVDWNLKERYVHGSSFSPSIVELSPPFLDLIITYFVRVGKLIDKKKFIWGDLCCTTILLMLHVIKYIKCGIHGSYVDSYMYFI